MTSNLADQIRFENQSCLVPVVITFDSELHLCQFAPSNKVEAENCSCIGIPGAEQGRGSGTPLKYQVLCGLCKSDAKAQFGTLFA